MKTAYEVVEEIGKSLYQGDRALLILRKWGEQLIDKIDSDIADIPEVSNRDVYDQIGEILENVKRQL